MQMKKLMMLMLMLFWYGCVIAQNSETQYETYIITTNDKKSAKEIIQQLDRGASFTKLASEKSINLDSAGRGGYAGWGPLRGFQPKVISAISKLKKGTYTKEPIADADGLEWHVILVSAFGEEDRRRYVSLSLKENLARLIGQSNTDKLIFADRADFIEKTLAILPHPAAYIEAMWPGSLPIKGSLEHPEGMREYAKAIDRASDYVRAFQSYINGLPEDLISVADRPKYSSEQHAAIRSTWTRLKAARYKDGENMKEELDEMRVSLASAVRDLDQYPESARILRQYSSKDMKLPDYTCTPVSAPAVITKQSFDSYKSRLASFQECDDAFDRISQEPVSSVISAADYAKIAPADRERFNNYIRNKMDEDGVFEKARQTVEEATEENKLFRIRLDQRNAEAADRSEENARRAEANRNRPSQSRSYQQDSPPPRFEPIPIPQRPVYTLPGMR
jgi:hypothetical protein